MDDFAMRSKLTILHMWITSLEYTGTDPTLYIKSTLWYPSNLEKITEPSFQRLILLEVNSSNFLLPTWCLLQIRVWRFEMLLLLPILLFPESRVLWKQNKHCHCSKCQAHYYNIPDRLLSYYMIFKDFFFLLHYFLINLTLS